MLCYGGLSRLGQTPFVLSLLCLPPSWSHSQTNPPLHGGPPPPAAPSNILLAHQYWESQLLFVNSLNEYIEHSIGGQAWITSPHLTPESRPCLSDREVKVFQMTVAWVAAGASGRNSRAHPVCGEDLKAQRT